MFRLPPLGGAAAVLVIPVLPKSADKLPACTQDGGLVPLFSTLRLSGKKVFLATNSLWDYTNVVMNFLLSGRVGSERNSDWLHHFDVVFTGRRPPHAQWRSLDGLESHPTALCAHLELPGLPLSIIFIVLEVPAQVQPLQVTRRPKYVGSSLSGKSVRCATLRLQAAASPPSSRRRSPCSRSSPKAACCATQMVAPPWFP